MVKRKEDALGILRDVNLGIDVHWLFTERGYNLYLMHLQEPQQPLGAIDVQY